MKNFFPIPLDPSKEPHCFQKTTAIFIPQAYSSHVYFNLKSLSTNCSLIPSTHLCRSPKQELRTSWWDLRAPRLILARHQEPSLLLPQWPEVFPHPLDPSKEPHCLQKTAAIVIPQAFSSLVYFNLKSWSTNCFLALYQRPRTLLHNKTPSSLEDFLRC